MLDRTGIALVGAIVLIAGRRGDRRRRPRGDRRADAGHPVRADGALGPVRRRAASTTGARAGSRARRRAPAVLLALTVAVGGRALGRARERRRGLRDDADAVHRASMRRGLDPRPFLIALTSRRQCRLGRDHHRQPAEHPDRPGRRARLLGVPARLRPAGAGGARDRLCWWSCRLAWPFRAGRCAGPARPAGDGAGAGPVGPGQGADRHRRCCWSCSRPSLPRTEGVLLVAGCLLISRKLATRRMLGLVDWHLLVLFGALFVVTTPSTRPGVPGRAVAALESARPRRSTSPWLLAPADDRGLEHDRQRAAGRPAAADPAGAEPRAALLPGRGLDPGRQPADRRQPRQHHHRRARARRSASSWASSSTPAAASRSRCCRSRRRWPGSPTPRRQAADAFFFLFGRGHRRFAHSHWSGAAVIQRANSSFTRAVIAKAASSSARPGSGSTGRCTVITNRADPRRSTRTGISGRPSRDGQPRRHDGGVRRNAEERHLLAEIVALVDQQADAAALLQLAQHRPRRFLHLEEAAAERLPPIVHQPLDRGVALLPIDHREWDARPAWPPAAAGSSWPDAPRRKCRVARCA